MKANKSARRSLVAGVRSRGLLCGASLTVVALLGLPSPAQASDRWWDANGPNVGSGGTGNWNTTGTNQVWSQSNSDVLGPYQAWVNNSADPDSAIFGLTAPGTTTTTGTITLTEPIIVNDLTFQTVHNWVLNGDRLTLAGTTPTITTHGLTTIDSVIDGTAGLTKLGGQQLILTGTNLFSGGITLGAGTLHTDDDAALGAASNNISVTGTSTLRINAGSTSRTVTINNGVTLTLLGPGTGSAFYTGAGNLIVSPNAGDIRLSNDASNFTGTVQLNGCHGVCSHQFTSIGNVGQASSLGAGDTIIFQQASQYSDSIVYVGDGDSSNRTWDINGNSAGIYNRGTGTLILTGNIDSSGGTTFVADDAGIELLGTLSGANYGFSASAATTLTLGGANTYSGATSISGGRIIAPVLANSGANSSFGVGSTINLGNLATLSYTGIGASSDRIWTSGGATALHNDGTGALALSGTMSLASGTVTFGGSYAGTNIFSGVISGTGNLGSTGSGTWELAGANTRTGTITVNGGTLRAANAAAFGTITGVTVNGGTLDLNDFDMVTPTINGTGGTIALGAAPTTELTVNGSTNSSYGGNISGAGSLVKLGTGTLTLTGGNTYSGDTRIGGGTLRLDFTAGGPTSQIIANSSTVIMSGGTLNILGGNNETNVQNFGGLVINIGNNVISATSGTGTGSVTVDFGLVTHNGGLVNFILPTNGSFLTDSPSLGGWATVNSSDYAVVDNRVIRAFLPSDYTPQDNAALWANNQFITDVNGYTGTVGSNVQLGGLRYTRPVATTVTIAPGQTLGTDGTIIVAPTVGAFNQVITGGSLRGGASGLLGVQQNSTGNFTIASTIVDNGGATGFAKAGTGLVTLTGNNSYTGVTTISGGTLAVNSIGNGGENSAIGASGSASSNLVIESGTLRYTGGTDTTDRGLTLINGGPSRTIEVSGSTNLTFGGQITSPDDAGFTKTGSGILTLANGSNNYVGPTRIEGGTLSVSTLSDGGLASDIGASSAASSNLVIQGGGRLQYTGGTVTSDRGFTLGTGNGRISVDDGTAAETVLTLSGTAIGAGGLLKDGVDTLVLSGTNTYTGGTHVTAGTLRAGSTSAFGADGWMTVDAGATLDLAGNNIGVWGLAGSGTVLLGSATLSKGGAITTFSGTISGQGGFTNNGWYQTFVGCNNNYQGATTINNSYIFVDCLANGGQASGIGASSSASTNLTLNNGTLVYTGTSINIDRGINLAGNGAVDVTQNGTTLGIGGIITGAGAFIKRGGGALVLTGTNNNTGGTVVEGGTLRLGTGGTLGTGGLRLSDVAGAQLDLNNTNTTVAWLDDGGALGGNILLGSATLTISRGENNSNWAYAGAINGSGSLVKAGPEIQRLTGCGSDYTGTTTITGGVLEVACLNDGGVNSAIGRSGAEASNLILNGGTLEYIGTGGSTNRLFTLGASTASRLEASGTGAIVFGNTAPIAFSSANTNQTIALGGTSTANNSLAALITNNGTGTTSLTKAEAGTWILTNSANTYQGVTTISGGVLGVDTLADGGQASSIGMSSNAASNLVIGTGGTLRYTGDGDSTDRRFTLGTGTTAIESSGTGAIEFLNTAAIAYSGGAGRVLALGGTNAGNNIMGATIGNLNASNLTSLAKNDVGTWMLTGTNTYTGSTNVNGGTLYIGAGAGVGSISSGTVNIASGGTFGFNRNNDYTFAGLITGGGRVVQAGTGRTILTGTSNYTGGTTISAGTLQLGDGGATGSILGNVTNNATLVFNRNNSYQFDGVISGTGVVNQIGAGTTILTAINSYQGGTNINAGTLQVSADANLGAAAGPLTFNGGTLRNTASFTSARAATLTGAGTFLTDPATTLTLTGAISGAGALTKSGTGTLVLTADNAYGGGTTISAGTLQLGNGGATGSVTGNIVNNGALTFNRSNSYTYAGTISGSGAVNQNGSGITVLTGPNSYLGATNVNAGTLLINGNQSAATGLITVASGATLGGSGRTGAGVLVQDGGILAPGNSPGTLTIDGALSLGAGSILNMEFGQANVVGGPLNDLINVGGNLTLDGTINVTVPAGGSFGPGVYRVINYGGSLTDNGLALGTMPAGSSVAVQTSVLGQVNLVNAGGLTLNFWDSPAGTENDNVIQGGTGTWILGDTNDWTDSTGGVNGDYAADSFAVFTGAAGTVTVDNSAGAVTASGMQFAVDGYTIAGAPLTLTGADATIRVGDGTAAGSAMTATISAQLTGTSRLVKEDLGTLVLTGTNLYAGGTAINDGTLQVSSDANLGAAAGGLAFDGGTLRTTATFGSTRAVTLTGAGTVLTDAATTLTLSGAISGAGALTKSGAGTLVLTADNGYAGGTTISAGTLQLGDGGTTGSIVGDVLNNGVLTFNRSNALSYGGAVTGTGAVNVIGGGVATMTGDSVYSGNTRVTSSALRLASGGSISTTGTVTVEGTDADLIVDGAGSVLTTGRLVLGPTGASSNVMLNVQAGGVVTVTDTSLTQVGNGGANPVTVNIDGAGSLLDLAGGIGIGSTSATTGAIVNITNGGRLESVGGGLGIAFVVPAAPKTMTVTGAGSTWANSGAFAFYNGSLSILNGGTVTAASGTMASFASTADLLVSGANSAYSVAGNQTVGSGTGTGIITLAQGGTMTVGGTLTLATVPNATGVLNIGGAEAQPAVAAGTLNAATLAFGSGTGRVNFNHIDSSYVFSTIMSGGGTVNQNGPGTTILTSANSYSGATNVNAGTLLVNGSQAGATGLTTVASAATLGGTGTIGGSVAVANGGILTAGSNGVGTLTIAGGLTLGSGSILNMEFGQANTVGGALNDLINVGGNLTLDGTINVSVPAGGSFGPGIYRVFNYAGTLTDNGLTLGSLPVAGDVSVQTSVVGQVNLVNATGVALNFWDGTPGVNNDGIIQGGNGTWIVGDTDDWTNSAGALNGDYAQDAFAVFTGTGGTVTVDNSVEPVRASGMQFAVDGYTIAGGPLTLTGAQATIRVGDGTAAGAGMTATVGAVLSGASQLVKADLGTLVLSGTNTYSGGTAINGGTLQIASEANLGAAAGLSFNGGMLRTTASFASARAVDLIGGGGIDTDAGTVLTWNGTISGAGAMMKAGAGTLILTADNSYAGNTLISAGTLQLGNGGTTGAIGGGNVLNNGTLAFNRSDSVTFANAISGSGALDQNGTGTTILTGTNSYAGATDVNAGTLLINGNQAAATGLVSVASGAALGGSGTIGGSVNVASGATLAAGSNGVGTLTINGNLSLGASSTLAMQFGQANTVGGALNDLIQVGGNLTLDGTLDVTVPAGGSFGAGIYRVINYGGTLTDNGLALGTLPAGSDVSVQTSVLGQVNLVNTAGLTLNFWDGTPGVNNDGVIQGGNGTWILGDTNDWTDSAGSLNGDYGQDSFAIFTGTGGTVTVDNSVGQVRSGGMQFATGGYTITGGAITLTGAQATVRVGDGSAAGAAMTATIGSQLTGTSQLVKTDAGTLVLTGANTYSGGTSVEGGTLLVNGNQSGAAGAISVASGATLGGNGTLGGNVSVANGATIAPGSGGVGTLTVNGNLNLAPSAVLNFEFGQANVVGGPLNDLIQVNGDLVLDGTINVAVPAGGSFGAGVNRVINYGGTLTNNGLALGTIPAGGTVTVQTSIPNQVNLVNAAGLTLNFWDGAAGPKNNSIINGGNGVWQNNTGNDNWTDSAGAVNAPYTNGAFAIFMGAPGTVSVDNGLGQVSASGMQFAVDGYTISGNGLTLAGPQATVRVGDGTAASAGMTATISAELSGPTQLVKTDLGTLVLTGTNLYVGGTAINEGVLQVSGDANLGAAAGALSFGNGGTLRTTATFASGRAVTLGGAGTFLTDAGTTLTLNGGASGAGSLTKAGTGILVLTADSNYAGGTTISAGILQLGNGGATGAITGNIVNNATLNVNRSNAVTLAGVISGSGTLNQNGAGTTILSGANSYTGATNANAGTLLVNGNQAGATGLTSVASGATLGGSGTIGGSVNVASGGTLTAGSNGVGTLTINGNLSLGSASTLAMQFGQANTVGGPLNDLINVGGNLTLDGTIDVTVPAGGAFGAGIYRVINYAGTLTDNGLSLGSLPGGSSVTVQTSVLGQVNLVNTAGLTLNFWDGGAGPKNNSQVNGGDGDWQLAGTANNWTDSAGSVNGAYTQDGFAVFAGSAGTVTVDNSLGQVRSGGMQFATGGYTITGGPLTLTGAQANVRVGDGSAAGAGMTATIASQLTGTSQLVKTDAGTLVLTGANSYSGGTSVEGGTLLVNGNQAGAAGATNVAAGATLGGTGTLGGNVIVANGGALAPGSGGVGTLTVNGNLNLAPSAVLNFELGQANVVGGPLNDLIQVNGDLVLDGTINVAVPAGGSFGAGVNRVINYGGTLTNNGLALGSLPGGSNVVVQTSIAGQVNLVNATGLTLNFWDGAAGPKNNNVINGGNGVWQNNAGNDNWTDSAGAVNAPYTNGAFAIFMGAPGTVSVDNSLGQVSASGMQFAVNGYTITGDALALTGPQSTIRVGDGTAASAGMTATIASQLTGNAQLVKTDLGTLVLTGANTYSGGTAINGGTLQLGNGGASGAIGGNVVNDGVLAFNRSDSVTFAGTISGSGSVRQIGSGTTILTADNGYTGGTTIAAGTLQLGNGGTTGGIVGAVANNGTLNLNRSNGVTLAGVISGNGVFNQNGTGTTTLTGANSYTGATNVNAGTLLVDGNQAAATGLVSVASGATLGGSGTIGGSVNVSSGATLAAGSNGVGTLTINGNLSLGASSNLAMQFGQAGTVGGALNDLIQVGGNLTLDGAINVTVPAGGSFGAGIYRVINYGGTLTDNGLALGTLPTGADVSVQTSVLGQVNLVNTAGLTLNFWDGTPGINNDGVIQGGNGTWILGDTNDWTDSAGSLNGDYGQDSFAIFTGTGGNVTVDNSAGQIRSGGVQFATGGYTITGGAITLTGAQATVRVGDGSPAGAGMTATIGSVLGGTSQLVKTDSGTLVLTGANTYGGGTAINGGTLQISSDGNLGAASGGLSFNGAALRTTATFASARSIALVGAGGVQTDSGTTLTLSGAVSGAGWLTKFGAGTLVLGGTNTYAGGTFVDAGTLQIASDANLGAASGGVTFNGGTLATTANLTSERTFTLTGAGTVSTAPGTTFTFGGVLRGAGALTKAGAGTLVLTRDNGAFLGPVSVSAGTLNVAGVIGSAVTVNSSARLEGTGRVGSIANNGVVAPGSGGFGTLTVAGNYAGTGGTLEIETVLGGDNSQTDRLVVNGATSGATEVIVTNRDGLGAQTIEGIKVIDIGGASNGTFTLRGDYLFQGDQAVVAGAFAYRLVKNGVSTPADGDWYLRSNLIDEPETPLYQPGVPVYESYARALQTLNGLPTLKERVGNRQWSGFTRSGVGMWGRIESSRDRPEAAVTTTGADTDINSWTMQAGFDAALHDSAAGTLIVGVNGRYGTADARIGSAFGNGGIDTTGYGLGGTLTWYGAGGFYVDVQGQVSWYDSDLDSDVLGGLVADNDGRGEAFSVEVGQRLPIGGNLSITPQAQLVYSNVRFDRFVDPSGAEVAIEDADSLRGRIGLSIDHQRNWTGTSGQAAGTHLYGFANLEYELADGARADVAGTPILRRDDRLWGELGAGGSYSWGGGRFTLYSEASAQTALGNFGDSTGVRGTVGFRLRF